MNILEAIRDPGLFRPFLADEDDGLDSWSPWFEALRCLYGLPMTNPELVKACTGRETMPGEGFAQALFLTGRRSGKSRTAGVIAAYEACLSGRESRLARGEQGVVCVISPTKRQSQVVHGYVRGLFSSSPILMNEVVKEEGGAFVLRNGIRIETLVADWRTVRNFTLLAVILDECCFLGYSEESKVKSDTELVRALLPGLATTGGRLVAISSPYAERGWAYQTFKKHHGNDRGRVLVWNTQSRTMNPTLPQGVVDDALAEDPESAAAEYLGQFRRDVAGFVTRDVVESLVVPGRTSLPFAPNRAYVGFVDMSGGRSDDAALAIAHRTQDRIVVIDRLDRFRPPHNPHTVVAHMAMTLKSYGLTTVLGDAYSAEWSKTAFESHGIKYERAGQSVWTSGVPRKVAKTKSQLYVELLPMLHAAQIELPDDPTLVSQLAGLERRTRSGGKDVIDHGPNSHDDLANAIAGAANYASQRRVRAGALVLEEKERDDMDWRELAARFDERMERINARAGWGSDGANRENLLKALNDLHQTDSFFTQQRRPNR